MTIKDIGHEMAKQDNRATQYPMFAVYEIVEVPSINVTGDGRYYSPDGCTCGEQKGVADKEDDDFDPAMHDETCVYWIEEKLQPNLNPGIFFTAEACQAHIDANHYHYNKPVVYGIGSWRNPEMQLVQQHILEVAGEKIPSHYE